MNPVETGGISPKLKSVTGSNCAENPQRFPRVNAPIREGSVTEGSECRAREDIPEIGCREGLEAAAPSTVKESPRRPCSGWRREKCWADGWPARVPYTAGEKQLCLLTCGEWTGCKGGKTNASPNCQPVWKWGWIGSAHQASKGGCDRFKWGERVRGGQKRFRGLASPGNGETTLLIPSRRSGTTRVSRSGRLVGPLHVNPLAWLLAGRRPAAGSPNRSGGKARGLGWKVPCSPRHELLESSRLSFGWAELVHYSANSLPEQPRLWDGCVH